MRRARDGKLTAEDFAGVTISLTNPGTIGTVHSVPRLMRGQGAIIGVGAMEYPAEFQGASEERISELGVGKLITLTSTYDHRIIQGAESGDFLRTIHELLLVRRVLRRDLPRTRHPLRAGAVAHRQPGFDRGQERPRHRAHRGLPQSRSPDGRHRPAAAGQDPVPQPPRPRRQHPRADAVGSGPGVQGQRFRRRRAQEAARRPGPAARRVLPPRRRRVHPHPRTRAAEVAAGTHRGQAREADRRRAEVHPVAS